MGGDSDTHTSCMTKRGCGVGKIFDRASASISCARFGMGERKVLDDTCAAQCAFLVCTAVTLLILRLAHADLPKVCLHVLARACNFNSAAKC